MRACIHRGSRQIGGSCVEIECVGKRLLVDFGLPLNAEKNKDQYLPNIQGLDGRDPSLLGILISHPHLDHFGLLSQISENIPVGMGAAARRILDAAAPFLPGNWSAPQEGWNYRSGQTFNVGPFRITPFLVDHSAYDSYAILIEGGGKSLFYSGDFRAHGRKAALFDNLLTIPFNIDALLLEGSSLGRIAKSDQFPTEEDVEQELTEIFRSTKGMVLVHTSGQNIDRIVSIFKASKRTGRKLIIDLYTAVVLEATGNAKIPQSTWSNISLYIPQTQRVQIKENAWFDLLQRHSGQRIFIEDLKQVASESTLLFRPLHRFDLERADCLSGATYVYSLWEGYWEQGAYDKVRDWLEKHSIMQTSVHTSGHASPGDLRKLAAALNPKKIIPIHSFFPEKYPRLFRNVEIHNDNEWWEV